MHVQTEVAFWRAVFYYKQSGLGTGTRLFVKVLQLRDNEKAFFESSCHLLLPV